MTADFNVKKKDKPARKSLTVHNSIYSKEGAGLIDQPQISEDGKKMSVEERLTKNAMDKYMRKKQRYMKQKRVFDDDKIATLDEVTEKRTGLIASLLGNSKEAKDIQRQFRKMIEVPQEEFSLHTFKELTQELKNNVCKPSQIYKDQLKVNPLHVKKLSSIEDYVSIQTAPIESNTRFDEDIDVERDVRNIEKDTLYTETGLPKEEILAITDDPNRIMAIDEGESRLKL